MPRGVGAAALVLAAILSRGALADPCAPWPGEPDPLPGATEADPLRARWAELRAYELDTMAAALREGAPLEASRLWRHARCLAPESAATAPDLPRAVVRVHRPELRLGAGPAPEPAQVGLEEALAALAAPLSIAAPVPLAQPEPPVAPAAEEPEAVVDAQPDPDPAPDLATADDAEGASEFAVAAAPPAALAEPEPRLELAPEAAIEAELSPEPGSSSEWESAAPFESEATSTFEPEPEPGPALAALEPLPAPEAFALEVPPSPELEPLAAEAHEAAASGSGDPPLPDLVPALVDARAALHAARYDEAIARVEAAQSEIAAAGGAGEALGGAVWRRQRAELLIVQGTAELALGHQREARAHFAEAALMSPGLELDPRRHSPKVIQAWSESAP